MYRRRSEKLAHYRNRICHKLPINAVSVPKINYRETHVGHRCNHRECTRLRASSGFLMYHTGAFFFISFPPSATCACLMLYRSCEQRHDVMQRTHLRGTKFPTGSASTFRSPLSSSHPRGTRFPVTWHYR